MAFHWTATNLASSTRDHSGSKRSLGQFVRSQSNDHRQIVALPTACLNVNHAPNRLQFFQAPELGEKLRIVRQFDLALHEQMSEVAKYLRSRVLAKGGLPRKFRAFLGRLRI
jgi:hypothetical protein